MSAYFLYNFCRLPEITMLLWIDFISHMALRSLLYPFSLWHLMPVFCLLSPILLLCELSSATRNDHIWRYEWFAFLLLLSAHTFFDSLNSKLLIQCRFAQTILCKSFKCWQIIPQTLLKIIWAYSIQRKIMKIILKITKLSQRLVYRANFCEVCFL